MRIIAGEKRGKKLITLEGEQVRPTTDRVKESLFNIIQFSIAGRDFLDMFAGSGQIGLEALSRGAKSATLIDASPKSIEVCKKNIEEMAYESKVNLVNANAQTFVANTQNLYDVAFLDPPYHENLLEESLFIVSEKMRKGGTIVCEHPANMRMPERLGDFSIQKVYKYGKIAMIVYRNDELE